MQNTFIWNMTCHKSMNLSATFFKEMTLWPISRDEFELWNSKPSRFELGHFNFRNEYELTILTIWRQQTFLKLSLDYLFANCSFFKKWLITFHFSKNMLSFSKCDSFSKGAFVFNDIWKYEKMWKVSWGSLFLFPKNIVNKDL